MSRQLATIPQANVSVRDAAVADAAFIDSLQKLHSDRVGFMRTEWIETKINKREVIVAADESSGAPVGYCIGVDRYRYRDDVGIIYQLNVSPGKQRGFVGMTLLKAMFDRAAYGCRLFSCWCAQDIEANRFWEAMGFLPLAYRAGSEKKQRTHIFWQKRIREGDTTTPWWFPAKTDAGMMREDRLVLPVPPGKHWSEEMPRIVMNEQPVLSDRSDAPKVRRSRSKVAPPAPLSGPVKHGPRQFGPPPAVLPAPALAAAPTVGVKPKPEKKPKAKADPRLVAAARELRDRWLERVNSGEMLIEGAGKYDVVRQRQLTAAVVQCTRLLPAA